MEQETQNSAATDGAQKKKNIAREVRSWVLTLGIPVVVVLFLNLFICRFVVVIGDSMLQTLHDKDLMLVRQIAYTPEAGDIVVVSTEENSRLEEKYIVKRVIAVAGQTVAIDYDKNTVTVDGDVLSEPYINAAEEDPMRDRYLTGNTSYTVPDGCVFVMGDNRNHSLDSRSEEIGMLPESTIMGGVLVTFPTGRLFGD